LKTEYLHHSALLMNPILHTNTLYWVTQGKKDEINNKLIDELLDRDSRLLCYPEGPVLADQHNTPFHAAATQASAN
jgi:hypothetical protein